MALDATSSTSASAPVPSPVPVPVRPPAVSYLCFDYGLKRTGVASGNRVMGMASPLTTVTAEGDARFAPIAKLIAEWRPDALVVGVPFHPDGAEHENTLRARRFGRQLFGRFRLPVHEVDERYSTTEAHSRGARHDQADAAAAAILLQQFFDELARQEQRLRLQADTSPDDGDTLKDHP